MRRGGRNFPLFWMSENWSPLVTNEKVDRDSVLCFLPSLSLLLSLPLFISCVWFLTAFVLAAVTFVIATGELNLFLIYPYPVSSNHSLIQKRQSKRGENSSPSTHLLFSIHNNISHDKNICRLNIPRIKYLTIKDFGHIYR